VLIRLEKVSGRPSTDRQTVDDARRGMRDGVRIVEENAAPMFRVDEVTTDAGLRTRVYVPRQVLEPLPMLVYFHGGGFVIGDLDTHDRVCRRLARDADCVVASIDYRLAPEARFPAAAEDAYASFLWAVRRAERFGADPARVAVGGDSAGGNLSAVCALLARDASGPRPCFQLLVYPATDLHCTAPSHSKLGRGYILTTEVIDWFISKYADRSEYDDPRGSPLLAKDHRDLPPACVVTAGFDPLRDEGRAYVEKLRAAGVRVRHHEEPSLIHGFFNMAGVIPAARRACLDIARELRAGLHAHA
jgi:acetyl esterase